MPGPLIAIVGDISPTRVFTPPMADPSTARLAAEQLGAELARRGARLLVYGGPYLEADVVRGFAAGKPTHDKCIVKWYTQSNQPPPFPEEATQPKLFDFPKVEKGGDWEVAFYRSLTRAEGIVLIGGDNATKISGYVAIGSRLGLLALAEFGGGANKVWASLSAGDDLPTRADIDLMARPWRADSAPACIEALFAQLDRRRRFAGAPRPMLSLLAGILFLLALAIVPFVWGGNALPVWMLFFAPVLAGGAGAGIRPVVDRLRGDHAVAIELLATVVLGIIAGGVAGVLFVTAQLTADPQLTADAARIVPYAQRSIPFAVGVGFIAGLTSDAVFGKLLGMDIVRTSGVVAPTRGA